jgi:beta-phosphoglucomutase-like phosphatase (HAD superfamily)
MNKAFLFDMDGVLIDTESTWGSREHHLHVRLFGAKIAKTIESGAGVSITTIYKMAQKDGASISYDDFKKAYDESSQVVYNEAGIAPGVNELAVELLSLGFRLGLVTSSPQNWIDRVLPRLAFGKDLEVVISLFDHPKLATKPDPGGYIEALRVLKADPTKSFVLEDSVSGITAGKGSGAYVIGYLGMHANGYRPEGADEYAKRMEEVAGIVRRRTIQP